MEGVHSITQNIAMFKEKLRLKKEWDIKGKLIFLIPTYASVPPIFVSNFLILINKLNELGINYEIKTSVNTFLVTAREKLAQYALDSGAEWVIWLDSDSAFSWKSMLYLIESAQKRKYDIVGPVIFTRTQPYDHCIFQSEGDKYKVFETLPKGREWLDGDNLMTGIACLIMHRDIIEKVSKPRFRLSYHENGRIKISEDFYFLEKAKKAGAKIGINLFVEFGHYGGIVWNR